MVNILLPTLAVKQIGASMIRLLAPLILAPSIAMAADVQVIHQALFRFEADTTWREVNLPHAWHTQGTPAAGQGLYKFTFVVPESESGSRWAMSTAAMSTRHQIRVNGASLEVSGDRAGDHAPPHLAPVLLEIPPWMIRKGENVLEVREQLGWGGGLLTVSVGPLPDLLPIHERFVALHATAPQLINIATFAMALFMLSIWWNRRQEEVLGFFALMWLPVALRNYSYFVTTSPLPEEVLKAAFLIVNIESSLLFALLGIAASGQSWPRLRPTLIGSAVAALALVPACVLSGITDVIRSALYPVLLASTGFGAWLLLRRASETPTRLTLALTACGVLCLLSAIHDYLAWRGTLGIDFSFWIPWLSPLLFVCIAMSLLARMVRALDEAETLAARLELRVAERTAQIELANTAKTRFIAATSHDLRQPMHALVQYVGHMKHINSEPDGNATLAKIEESVAAMEDLLNAVLDFSKISIGSIKPTFRVLSIDGILDAIDTQIRPLAHAKSLNLRIESDGGFVRSDEVLLERVLGNIAHNAVKYTPSGTVAIRAVPRAGVIRVLVSDSGVGIAPAEKPRIFDEYYQVDNPARDRRRGLGLGLAIVRDLVQLLGARIRVKSALGRGSTFVVDLPVALAPPGLEPDTPAERSIDYVRGAFIVLIDDDRSSREAVFTTLKDFGCRVVAAASPAEALSALSTIEFCPQIILSDYRLERGLDGLQAIAMMLDELRGLYGDDFSLPAIIISGDTSPEVLQQVAGAGLQMLHKPVRAKLLHESLNAILDPVTEPDPASGTPSRA